MMESFISRDVQNMWWRTDQEAKYQTSGTAYLGFTCPELILT
jgi:hypothetical protein